MLQQSIKVFLNIKCTQNPNHGVFDVHLIISDQDDRASEILRVSELFHDFFAKLREFAVY